VETIDAGAHSLNFSAAVIQPSAKGEADENSHRLSKPSAAVHQK
jgi:hypothetical protein